MTKSIELTGNIDSNFLAQEAISRFATLFRCEERDVERLLNKAPLIIKEGLDPLKAEKLKTLIDDTGLECLLLDDEVNDFEEPELAIAEADDENEEAPAPMTFGARVKSWFGR